ncbi:MAG: hypothetical protein V1792_20290 [Pseudomonadota bacterium]
MDASGGTFDQNVFINCPFDGQYKPLLRALLFTLIYCGLTPRIASERGDSGEVRITKILELIKACKYSIHDLSRMEPLETGDLPRFNMPFELGLDIGCKETATGELAGKKSLILERERFRYQRVLSDLSGNDIKDHHGEPQRLVRQVRHWLVGNVNPVLPTGTEVWEGFNRFCDLFDKETRKLGYKQADLDEMTVTEEIYFINLFLGRILRKPPRRRSRK